MLGWLPLTTGSIIYGFASAFDAFVSGWNRPFSEATINAISWDNVTVSDISTRLSILFNTFWLTSQWNVEVTDLGTINLSAFTNVTAPVLSIGLQHATATIT